MSYIIYKITNTTNQVSYVGVTNQTIEQRWYQHCWKSKHHPTSHFHRAINKYGKDSFTYTTLFSGFDDRAAIEQLFILEHNTYNCGYNSTVGGEDFTSSEYQRQLQLDRVYNGTHPFLGGRIQYESSKRSWDNGTNSLIGLNQKRLQDGTHNLLGDSNPQRIRKINGEQHHNQKHPWMNTKTNESSIGAWKIADQLYIWFKANEHKKRGGSYKAMAKQFNIESSLQVMYYKYFKEGWNPSEDESWLEWSN